MDRNITAIILTCLSLIGIPGAITLSTTMWQIAKKSAAPSTKRTANGLALLGVSLALILALRLFDSLCVLIEIRHDINWLNWGLVISDALLVASIYVIMAAGTLISDE